MTGDEMAAVVLENKIVDTIDQYREVNDGDLVTVIAVLQSLKDKHCDAFEEIHGWDIRESLTEVAVRGNGGESE